MLRTALRRHPACWAASRRSRTRCSGCSKGGRHSACPAARRSSAQCWTHPRPPCRPPASRLASPVVRCACAAGPGARIGGLCWAELAPLALLRLQLQPRLAWRGDRSAFGSNASTVAGSRESLSAEGPVPGQALAGIASRGSAVSRRPAVGRDSAAARALHRGCGRRCPGCLAACRDCSVLRVPEAGGTGGGGGGAGPPPAAQPLGARGSWRRSFAMGGATATDAGRLAGLLQVLGARLSCRPCSCDRARWLPRVPASCICSCCCLDT